MGNTVNVVIIGGSGHWHIVTDAMKLCPDLRVLGIAPGRPEEDLSSLLSVLSAVPLYPDWRELIELPGIDCAVVNPWFCDAADVSIACLRQGLNVYSEKPLATETEALCRLEAAWRESGRALGGMLNYRFFPWFLAMEQAVRAGEIGEIRQIHAQKSYRMGNRPDFYRRRQTMGGLLPWVGIHGIDWINAFAGKCLWVTASHSRGENRGHGDMEVTSAALLQMENEVIATVTADYFRPDGSARHDDDRLRITGTRGMIEAMDGQVYLENENPRRRLELPPMRNAFLAFHEAVQSRQADPFAESALHITRVALLARDSADQGGSLQIIR